MLSSNTICSAYKILGNRLTNFTKVGALLLNVDIMFVYNMSASVGANGIRLLLSS